jgi:hypothetical protein
LGQADGVVAGNLINDLNFAYRVGSSGGNENINGFSLLPLVGSGILIEVIKCLVDVGKACHTSMINGLLQRVEISLSNAPFSKGLQRMSFFRSP